MQKRLNFFNCFCKPKMDKKLEEVLCGNVRIVMKKIMTI